MPKKYNQAFISGPMSGIPNYNWPAFEEAERQLREAGWLSLVNPVELDKIRNVKPSPEGDRPHDYEKLLKDCINLVKECTSIIVLPGWIDSEGSRREVEAALAVGNKVHTLEWALQNPPMKEMFEAGEETRVTDEKTGGAKGAKLPQLGAVDAAALWELAKVAGHGAQKYSRQNYLQGYNWSLSVDSLYRHLLLFQGGQDTDSESGFRHTAHVAWHALALTSFQLRDLGTDDRFK